MKGPTTPFEIPVQMRAFAEQSFDQAKEAFDKFMSAAHTTMATIEGQSKAAQAGAKDINEKVMTFAAQNVATAFDYAQKLVHAPDPQALLQLHSEYVRSQMQVLSEQAKVLGETAKAAMESAKPKS